MTSNKRDALVPPGAAVEVTRLTKAGGPLTKRLHLAADGALTNNSSQCRMSRGRLRRVRLADWRDLAQLIEDTPYNSAWALGVLRDGFPDETQLVLKDDPRAGKPGFVARTAENFVYREGRPALVLLDFDTKGMPAAVKARITELGGFVGALTAVCPEFAGAGYIQRRSTSAGVTNSETGAEFPSAGEHVFVVAQDGADAHRFLNALHDRAWLAGFGWYIVGKAGQLLERSIVDRIVCAPERVVFEAPPDVAPPLRQRPRPATVHDGAPLATRTACPDLTTHETIDLGRRKAVAADGLKEEAKAALAAFVDEQLAKAVERGIEAQRARTTAEAWSKGVLRPSAMLDFDDPDTGTRTVADLLGNPQQFDGETLADPIEGALYGRNCAIVQSRNGGMQIYSFAHGGALYRLVHDAASVEAAMMAAAKDKSVEILARLFPQSDLGLDERKRLCRPAGARTGLGTRVAEKMAAEALAAQKEAEAEERRGQNALASTKARLAAPPPDAEAAPIMRQWDDILANASGPTPPMRDVERWPVTVEDRTVAGLHELAASGANDEEDVKTRLPAPKNLLLTKHSVQSLEIELFDYMTFVVKTKHGDRAVAPHNRFLAHWLKYKRSRLPTLRAVVTMPLAFD